MFDEKTCDSKTAKAFSIPTTKTYFALSGLGVLEPELEAPRSGEYDRLLDRPLLDLPFLAAFEADCLLGALPPVDFRALCFVRVIFFFSIN